MAMEGEIKTGMSEHFDWNVENEIHLFEAMVGYKPVGIHKHFHMACICEKFETLLGKSVSPNIIWDHLRDMYDLAALDKKETVQFMNEMEEFALPVSDFSELIAEKLSKTEIGSESSKEDKSIQKLGKDHSQGIETGKKEKKSEYEESNSETEKKEVEDKELAETKKGKIKREEKVVGKRGKRSLKDRKNEEENSQVSTPNIKKGDDESVTPQNNKKGKRIIGKRSLRSRTDDTSTKSSTPPPAKRARRI